MIMSNESQVTAAAAAAAIKLRVVAHARFERQE
jgi:hypothetical protein